MKFFERPSRFIISPPDTWEKIFNQNTGLTEYCFFVTKVRRDASDIHKIYDRLDTLGWCFFNRPESLNQVVKGRLRVCVVSWNELFKKEKELGRRIERYA